MARRLRSLTLEVEARRILGDAASAWLVKPSRLLDGMAPTELASSPEGRRIVIHELQRAAIPLKAVLAAKLAHRPPQDD